jgi:hypothetical protein
MFTFATTPGSPSCSTASAKPKRTPLGYDGAGFNISLSDTAAAGDVHLYRSSLQFTTDTPLAGLWQPDGRTADPAQVLDTSPRPAMLDSMQGLGANGDWTLLVADVSSGATYTLNGWGLDLVAVPEPAHFALAVALALCGYMGWSRRFRPRGT